MRKIKNGKMKRWIAYQGELYETYVYRDLLHRSFVSFPIEGESYVVVIGHKDVSVVFDQANSIFHEPGVPQSCYMRLVEKRNELLNR